LKQDFSSNFVIKSYKFDVKYLELKREWVQMISRGAMTDASSGKELSKKP